MKAEDTFKPVFKQVLRDPMLIFALASAVFSVIGIALWAIWNLILER
jgi:hypothetical protein